MNELPKRVDALTPQDFRDFPIWRYTNAHEIELDETAVVPVKRWPIDNLSNKVVGTDVVLANGAAIIALIGNIKVNNPELTEQVIGISVFQNGKWFPLARYFDFDYAENGPEALASFLGLPVKEVFPISYDLSEFAKGRPEALVGQILERPRKLLSDEERMAMIVAATAPGAH
jgi:hypothetical protein